MDLMEALALLLLIVLCWLIFMACIFAILFGPIILIIKYFNIF